MATSDRNRFLALLRANEDAMREAYALVAREVARLVLTAADSGGTIPIARWSALRREIGTAVLLLFLARNADGTLEGFEERNGRVLPQSAYMVALWAQLLAATQLAIEQHARLIRDHADTATRAALARANGVPDLNDYQPPQGRLWPDGRTLRDRLWRASGETRRKVDVLLGELLAENQSADAIAKTLTRFLTPGQTIRRRSQAGTTATLDGLRLARTEVVAQYAQAGMVAARSSPVITGFHVRLSLRHDAPDECDDYAAKGPYPLNMIEMLPPFHANCACYPQWVIGQRLVDTGVVGPLQNERFTTLLLTSRA